MNSTLYLEHPEPYTVSFDGHFVGNDGFVVPGSYAEFQERFPTHVRNFVHRHMMKHSLADREDRESELNIFLMSLPLVSKYREPGVNGRPNGCTDRVQTFHPDRAYGASKPRFLNFINFMLLNAFISLHKKASLQPIERPNNLCYFQGEPDHPSIVDDAFIQKSMLSDVFRNPESAAELVEERLLCQQIYEFIDRHNPDLLPVFRVIVASETFVEAQQELGMTEQLFTRARNRLYVLYECYATGANPPRQRKVYRPRRPKVSTLARVAALLLIVGFTLLTGCGSSRPANVNLDDHAGIFTASAPAQHEYAVIRLNPVPPTSLVTGYIYSTAAEARAEAAAGLPVGDEVLGQPAQVIRGAVTYTDQSERRHANRLAVSIQRSPDVQGKSWTEPAALGEGYFTGEGELQIEYSSEQPASPPTWAPWSPPATK